MHKWLSGRNARLTLQVIGKGGEPRCPDCGAELDVKVGGQYGTVLMVTSWLVACPDCQRETRLPAGRRSCLQRIREGVAAIPRVAQDSLPDAAFAVHLFVGLREGVLRTQDAARTLFEDLAAGRLSAVDRFRGSSSEGS